MFLPRPITPFLPAAALTCLVGPAAFAMMDSSDIVILRPGHKGRHSAGVAALGDAGILVLDIGEACDDCPPRKPGRLCKHEKCSSLRFLHKVEDKSGSARWKDQKVADDLPPLSNEIRQGPNQTVMVLVGDSEFRRYYLKSSKDRWEVLRWEHALTQAQGAMLGLGRFKLHSWTVGKDGSLFLGFDQSLAQVHPVASAGQEPKVQWLVGKNPTRDEGAGQALATLGAGGPMGAGDLSSVDQTMAILLGGLMGAGDSPILAQGASSLGSFTKVLKTLSEGRGKGLGLLLAADGMGNLMVVDRGSKMGYSMVSASPKTKIPMAMRKDWPSEDFVIDKMLAEEGRLIVSGVTFSLTGSYVYEVLVAEPTHDGKTCRAQTTGVQMDRFTQCTLTPSGHLVTVDMKDGRVWMVPDLAKRRLGAPETKGDSKRTAFWAGPSAAEEARAAAAAATAQGLERAAAAEAAARQARVESKVPRSASPEPVPAAPGKTEKATTVSDLAMTRFFRPGALDAPAAAEPAAGAALPRPEPVPDRRYPPGEINQRDIATMTAKFAISEAFERQYETWCRSATDPERTRPWWEARVKPKRKETDVPGIGRFTGLSEFTLQRVVAWMLCNAKDANPHEEAAVWKKNEERIPRFSFGLYAHTLRPGVGATLEIKDLEALVEKVEPVAPEAGPSLADELAKAGGLTGVDCLKDGTIRFVKGVNVAMKDDYSGFLWIRPGGVSGDAPPDLENLEEAEDAPAAPVEVKATAPVESKRSTPGSAPAGSQAAEAARPAGEPQPAVPAGPAAKAPFRLNPRAKAFVPIEEEAPAVPGPEPSGSGS